jgi:hypothetical protein
MNIRGVPGPKRLGPFIMLQILSSATRHDNDGVSVLKRQLVGNAAFPIQADHSMDEFCRRKS